MTGRQRAAQQDARRGRAAHTGASVAGRASFSSSSAADCPLCHGGRLGTGSSTSAPLQSMPVTPGGQRAGRAWRVAGRRVCAAARACFQRLRHCARLRADQHGLAATRRKVGVSQHSLAHQLLQVVALGHRAQLVLSACGRAGARWVPARTGAGSVARGARSVSSSAAAGAEANCCLMMARPRPEAFLPFAPPPCFLSGMPIR